jgi:RNA polymerase sigma factor (sigma-70 family)
MHSQSLREVVSRVRQVATAEPGRTDAELLDRFVRDADAAAFAELVRRHGALVHGVCRRLLAHVQDVEDAAQATFLILARRAAAIRNRASLSCWLHGVAVRTARYLRRQRQRCRTTPLTDMTEPQGHDDIGWRELRALLDEELGRLPEDLRAPLVLCYLQGLTRDEAAHALGWGVGRLKFRLEQARAVLRPRLLRRGVTLSAPLLAVLLSESAADACTMKVSTDAVLAMARGQAIDGLVPASVAALVRALVPSVLTAKVGILAGMLVLAMSGLFAVALPNAADTGDETAPAVQPLALQPHLEEKKPMLPPRDWHLLQGRWELIRAECNGKALPDIKGECSIKGDTITLPGPGMLVRTQGDNGSQRIELGTVSGTFRLDTEKTPRRLHITGRWNAGFALSNPYPFECLYKIEGELLTVVVPLPQTAPPPKFATREGKNESLLVFRRIFALQRVNVVGEAAAYHPDGKRYAVARVDKITLHDDATGKELLAFEGTHGPRITQLVFSPDGNTLASISHTSNVVMLWDVRSGKPMREFKGHKEHVIRVAFVGDGKRVASITGHGLWAAPHGDGELKVWEAATGTEVLALHKLPNTRAAYTAFSGDGRRFAISSWTESKVRVWDLTSGKLIYTLTGKTTDMPPAPLVALNADGSKLATFQPLSNGLGIYAVGGDDTSPNLATKMEAQQIAFTPTGALLAMGSMTTEDATGRVTTLGALQVFFPDDPKRKPFEDTYPSPANGVAFRPDGQKLLMLFTRPVDEPAPKQ